VAAVAVLDAGDDEELAEPVAGVVLDHELDAVELDHEPPHPAKTRIALTTTVETTFERFTFIPTAPAVDGIASNGDFGCGAATTPSGAAFMS
jgi:hypothetical protein